MPAVLDVALAEAIEAHGRGCIGNGETHEVDRSTYREVGRRYREPRRAPWG